MKPIDRKSFLKMLFTGSAVSLIINENQNVSAASSNKKEIVVLERKFFLNDKALNFNYDMFISQLATFVDISVLKQYSDQLLNEKKILSIERLIGVDNFTLKINFDSLNSYNQYRAYVEKLVNVEKMTQCSYLVRDSIYSIASV